MNRVLIPREIAAPPAPDPRLAVAELAGETMGTGWAVRLAIPRGERPETYRPGIEAVFDRIVRQMSTWREDSDISCFNSAPAGSWHALADDFFTVLECALTVSDETGGAFEPALGRLVSLWGFGPEGPRGTPPPPDSLRAARGPSRAALVIDRDGKRARQPGGLSLDFSAIAKGYAVDCAVSHLKEAGVAASLVDIGGELAGHGAKPDGSPWWVALDDAEFVAGPRTLVALHGLAVATSGSARRHFDHGGRRYTHLLDPRSGAPAANDIEQVTVLHRACMLADAYATAFAVMGTEKAVACADRLGIAARILHRTGGGLAESASRAFREMLD